MVRLVIETGMFSITALPISNTSRRFMRLYSYHKNSVGHWKYGYYYFIINKFYFKRKSHLEFSGCTLHCVIWKNKLDSKHPNRSYIPGVFPGQMLQLGHSRFKSAVSKLFFSTLTFITNAFNNYTLHMEFNTLDHPQLLHSKQQRFSV